ncbi:hypothetical protein [Paractinoplanes globisporus]|uniref:Uncharacterized protein n=1 Tax=Paractinoplanes globisporus TaxID=113565 RepID=A0ABW6W3E9_9ACTN|nr:hypothetical protein [Actinoplanes globisporus]
MSTNRPAINLKPAFVLGATLGVPVAAMCSGETRSDDVRAVARQTGTDVIVFEFGDMKEMPFAELRTASASAARLVGTHGDLGIKRNTGLVLGRLAGWRSVLFLDDDIYELDPRIVETAVAGLEHHTAVGMPALSFPDNSAVCHAYGLGVGGQDVFVSGSALAVDIRSADSFFPSIYNEDWLFLTPHLDRRRVSSFGNVRQKTYAPFGDPQRAEKQEFGDVLAEGLVGYLHSARLLDGPSIGYWAAFLERRAELISDARRGCVAAMPKNTDAGAALVALDAAERVRSKISAAQLANYVRAWAGDLQEWRRFLLTVPRLGTVEESITWLEIPAKTVTAERAFRLFLRDGRAS